MSRYGKAKHGQASYTFSGKDARGKPLTNHRHAFYLPTYESQRREIDHLTVIAPGGFGRDELSVLLSLDRLYARNSPDIDLVFQGCGKTGQLFQNSNTEGSPQLDLRNPDGPFQAHKVSGRGIRQACG